MMSFFEFFDAAFARLLWGLFVDYLVSAGFLLPSQRQIWVDGYIHIIGAAGAIIFTAIWLHHSNKQDQIKATVDETVQAVSKEPLLARFLKYALSKVTITSDQSSTPQQTQQ